MIEERTTLNSFLVSSVAKQCKRDLVAPVSAMKYKESAFFMTLLLPPAKFLLEHSIIKISGIVERFFNFRRWHPPLPTDSGSRW